MLKGSVKEAVKRLEDMKQITILRYLSNINLERDKDLYDEMISHFAAGELEEYFSSPALESLTESEAREVRSLAANYLSLCFYEGDKEYWADSIDDVPSNDFELIVLKLFDNYDFLLEIARDGNEEVLQQMQSFQNCVGYGGGSVIELMRNSFNNDSLLKQILIAMSREDSLYSIFTNDQKAELCRFPAGTLYTYDNGEVVVNDPVDLAVELVNVFDDYRGKNVDYDAIAETNKFKRIMAKLPIELIVSSVSDAYVMEHGMLGETMVNQKGKGMR